MRRDEPVRAALIGLVLVGAAAAAAFDAGAAATVGPRAASARAPTGHAGQARPVTLRAKIHPVGTPRAATSGGPAALRAAALDRSATRRSISSLRPGEPTGLGASNAASPRPVMRSFAPTRRLGGLGLPNRTRGAGAGTLGGPAAYDARKGAVLQGTGFKRRH